MGWRPVDEGDLAATLSQQEIDAYRRSASLDGSDPVARLLARTAALVRGYVATNGKVARMGPPGTLPESLVSPAMDYAAADVLKRVNVPMNEDRRKAREHAEELFRDVAAGKYTPESDGADGTGPTDGPAIEVVATTRGRVSAGNLEGL
ncbi:MAG: hypothetical protein IJQ73_11440 [Kiritimatiellae bacterium]|nr:hypothetical protein [Kiritimatiellia bacterium]